MASAAGVDGDDVPYRGIMFREQDARGGSYIGMVNGFFRDFKQKDEFRWCLNFRARINTSTNGGLPSGDENRAFQEFERAFLAALQERNTVFDVAHVSGGGEREYWWYGNSAEDLGRGVAEFLTQADLAWKIEYAVSRDERWLKVRRYLETSGNPKGPAAFLKRLFRRPPRTEAVLPLPIELLFESNGDESKADNALLAELRKRGADLKKATHFRHFLYLPQRDQAVRAQADLLATGYEAEVRLPESSLEGEFATFFSVVSGATAVPSIDNVSAMRKFLTKVAEEYGGQYDSWEAQIRP